MYEKEKYVLLKKLKDHNLIDYFTENNAFICGGAIRSVFAGERIQDYDVYFDNSESRDSFNTKMKEPLGDPVFTSENAITYQDEDLTIQVIYSITETIIKTIRNFDYTICMVAYDFRSQKFVFGDRFLQDLASRQLVYNIDGEYPISSLFRIKKYLARGYKISGLELIKLALRINNLNLSDYSVLKEQLMGIDTLLLKDLTDKLNSPEYAEKEYNFLEFMNMINQTYGDLFENIFEGKE